MNTRLHCALVLAALSTAAHAISPPVEVDAPRIDIVDSLSRVGDRYDIVTDANGRPHVAYIERGDAAPNVVGLARVRYAYFDGWTWRAETLGNIAEREDTAINRAVTLAVSGADVHVLAVESNNELTQDDRMVRFHRRADLSVTRQVIRSGEAAEPTIAIDAAGEVYVAWRRASPFLTGIEAGTLDANGNVTTFDLGTGSAAGSPSLATRANAAGATLAWTQCDLASGNCNQRAAFVGFGSVIPAGDITAPSPDGGGFVRVAINRQGFPEAMVVTGPVAFRHVEVRAYDGGDWECPTSPDCTVPTSEALLPGWIPAPHAFAISPFNTFDGESLRRAISVRLATRSTVLRDRVVVPGTFIDLPVASRPLPDTLELGSIAINRDGRAVLVGRTEDDHADLVAVKVDTSWRGRRAPNSTGTILSRAFALATARDGTPLMLGADSGGTVRLLRWRASANDFASETLPAGLDPDAASLRERSDFTLHAALHVRPGNDLVYAFRPAGSEQPWTTAPVDTAGDSGRAPSMLLYPDGTPAIVAIDGMGRVVLRHRRGDGTWGLRVLSGATSPGVDAAPRAVVAGAGFLLRASWFDPATGRLMLSSLMGDPDDAANVVLIQTTVETGTQVAGGQHDIALLADGQPMLAYTIGTTSQRLEVRYRRASDGAWLTALEPPTQLDRYLGLRLVAPGGSALQARLAYVQRRPEADRVWAIAPDGEGGLVASNFASPFFATPDAPQLALDAPGNVTFAVAESGGATIFRFQELVPQPGAFASLPVGASGASQTLPPVESTPVCLCLVLAFMNIDCEQGPPILRGGAGDASTMARMQGLFATTEAGRYYLGLFRTHSDEIVRITLDDPVQFAQRWRTWQDLLPGFRALVDGDGGNERFTPERIAAARDVMEGWRDAGSPALRDAVDAELARLDDLEVFAGMTFAEWFASLTPGGGAGDVLFRDGYE